MFVLHKFFLRKYVPLKGVRKYLRNLISLKRRNQRNQTDQTTNVVVTDWQGDQPHCGFPEARYHENAERLARAGLRVVVIEQTETPEQLRLRNEERAKIKLKKVRFRPKLLSAMTYVAECTQSPLFALCMQCENG